jgi:hypothetical protein
VCDDEVQVRTAACARAANEADRLSAQDSVAGADSDGAAREIVVAKPSAIA